MYTDSCWGGETNLTFLKMNLNSLRNAEMHNAKDVQQTSRAHQRELLLLAPSGALISSVRSSYSHPDLLLIHQQHHHPTFSDHTGPQHWTFTF